jgi:RHS repeat-associated protein
MPVDIASGNVHLEREDIRIPGLVELLWDRRYSCAYLQRPPTSLGHGWRSRYDCTLKRQEDGFVFTASTGGVELLADPGGEVDRGGVVRNLRAFLELFHQRGRYIVQTWDVETGSVWRYGFAPGRVGEVMPLRSIEDVTGKGTYIERDQGGRVELLEQRPGGRRLVCRYRSDGLLMSVALQGAPGSPLVRYEYDSRSRLVASFDAADVADRYEYDAVGRLRRELSKDGGVTTFAYDAKDRCLWTQGLDGYARKRFRYLEAVRMTEVTDSRGVTRRYQYLPSGQITSEWNAFGAELRTEYDEHSRVVGRIEAGGATSRYTYDPTGNRATVINALGELQQYEFNAHHLATSFTDAAGGVWSREYDEANRLVATTDPLQSRWRLSYDEDGRVIELVNPLGARRQQHWKGADLDALIDWAGNQTRFATDQHGRVVERIGPSGAVTRIAYDLAGNPVEVVLPDNTTLRAAYDPAANMTSFRDANGNLNRYRYGPCRRLLEQTDAVGGTVRYIWGTEPDALEMITNEKGETYTLVRNEEGLIVRERAFDGAERAHAYDVDGYSIRYVRADEHIVTLERDALHRIVRQSSPDGGEVTFTYDANGSLTSAHNSDAAVLFDRDAVGRVLREWQNEEWVASEYDAAGNLTRLTTSRGHAVDYSYDQNGWLSDLVTRGRDRVRFRRNAAGLDVAREMPGGMMMRNRYDEAGRLLEQVVSPGRPAVNGRIGPFEGRLPDTVRRRYTFGPTGSLASASDLFWGESSYIYDPADRLVRAVRRGGDSESFAYDAAGNIIRQHAEGGKPMDESLVYGEGSRLLTKGRSHRYEHDAEGRRTAMVVEANGIEPRVWRYRWSADDRLREVALPNGDEWRYQYDAFGRRVAKAGPTGEVRFLWRGHSLIHELDPLRAETTSWVFGTDPFIPIARVKGDSYHSIVTDHLGTAREMIDKQGAVVWRLGYKSFGEGTPDAATGDSCPFRFQGQYHDAETGLHYNRFRYYDPDVGSYTSQDPGVLGGGLNQYLYVVNPTGWVDPLGLTSGYPTLAEVPYVRSPGDEMVAMAKPSTKPHLLQTHTYVNPGTHDPSTPAYVATKSVLPGNHVELFRNSMPVEGTGGRVVRWTRVGSGSSAVYHRFEQSMSGEFHWNGSTDGVTKSRRPRAIPAHLVPKCVK